MTDSTGAVVWNADYKPFGEATITGTVTNNLRFPGQYLDAETGLHYNYYRDYNPTIGRYIQADPIGILEGMNHLFVYVENNPVNFEDPEGLRCTPKQQLFLQLMVQITCKWSGERHCSGLDSCAENALKIGKNSACAAARRAINNKCFNEGDKGHKMAEQESINAIKRCTELRPYCCKPKK